MSHSTARQLGLLSVEQYLASQQQSSTKQELVDGVAYAMVGGDYAHNLIANNLLGELHHQLRGNRCRALNSDTKIRTQVGVHTRFYYPDVSVICGDSIRRLKLICCSSKIFQPS
jgi:Uma2 family endonuclease